MNKSLKALFMTSMLPVMMLMAAVTLTSCEGTLDDIFGEWSRPTNQQNNEPTKEEVLTNLGAALEEGALVTITYTVDGVTYNSTFKKVGDEYVEQSTTSAARALTRASTSIKALIYYLGADNSYNFRAIEDEKIVLNVQIDVATATTTTTFSSNGAAFGGMTVNGQKAKMTSCNDLLIKVYQKGSGSFLGIIGCKQGQTWADLYKVESANGNMIIQIYKDDDQNDKNDPVFYSNGGVSGQLYKDADCTNPVLSGDEITQDVYVKVETISYLAASWNGTSVAYDISPSTYQYTLVSPSGGSVTWSGGTYVVKDNVVIKGNLQLDGNVNLILCDGAKLTVNGQIYVNGKYSLTIYGQSQDDDAGKLFVASSVDGLVDFKYLTIHGGNITVESQINGICNSPLTVYGGIVSITSNMYAIYTGLDKNMKVYGGEFNAISLYDIGINLYDGRGTLTVYGGKVTAQGGGGNPAIKGKFTAGEGIENVGFLFTDDKNNWPVEPYASETWPVLAGNERYFKAITSTPPSNP